MKEMVFNLAVQFIPVILKSKLIQLLLCSRQARIIIEAIRDHSSEETLLSLMRNGTSWHLLSFQKGGRTIGRLDFKTILDDLDQVEKLGYISCNGDKGSHLQYTILK